MKQLAEWTADAEPFGRAEQYGEHEQQEAQTITTVGWIVFADAGDGAYAGAERARNREQDLLPQRLRFEVKLGLDLGFAIMGRPVVFGFTGFGAVGGCCSCISGLILLVRGCMVGDDTVTIWSIDESRQPIRRVRLSRFPAGARICLIMGCMTPAERASAVAFALKNCALEAMTPGDGDDARRGGIRAGDNDVSALIDTADRETSGIVSGRLATGALTIMPPTTPAACSPERCCC